MSVNERAKRLLQIKQPYIPIVGENEKFSELINRQILMEYVSDDLVKMG